MEQDRDLAEWVETIKMLVRFSDVIPEDPDEDAMTVTRFQQLRQLAVYDVFFDMTNAEKCYAVQPRLDKNNIWRVRQHEDYRQIRDLLKQRAATIAKSGGMMDAAEQLEPQLAEKILHMALHGTGRDRLKALDEFTGRLSAKKGREDQLVVRMPPDLETAIASAMETARLAEEKNAKLLTPGGESEVVEAEVISASVVPLPDDG